MLDADPMLWRKPHKENFDDIKRKVMKFHEMWKKYDFTQKTAESSDSD